MAKHFALLLTGCMLSVHAQNQVLSRSSKGNRISLVTSLEEALMAAYDFNVELEQQRVALKELVNNVALANSEWNPKVNLSAQQKVDGSRENQLVKGYDPYQDQLALQSSARNKQRENSGGISLNAEQNLYQGGGTSARINTAKEIFKAGLCKLVAQEQSSFIKVIDSYIDTVVSEFILNVEILHEQHQKERLEQTKLRHEIGDQRLVDVEIARGSLAEATVRVTDSKRNVQRNRAFLHNLIGASLGAKLKMPQHYKRMPKSLDQLKHVALKNFPLLIAAQYDERAARYNAASMMAGLLPRIDLNAKAGPSFSWQNLKTLNKSMGTGYVAGQVGRRTQDANVIVSVSIPLVTGGGLQAQYRSAEQKVKEARLGIEHQRRAINELCESLFATFQATQQNVTSTKVALDAISIALDAGREEYILGMMSLLDINQVESQWLTSYRHYIQAMGELIKVSYSILQLTGQLTASSLGLKVCSYDPCEYYNKYKDAWFSLGDDETRSPLFSRDNKDKK